MNMPDLVWNKQIQQDIKTIEIHTTQKLTEIVSQKNTNLFIIKDIGRKRVNWRGKFKEDTDLKNQDNSNQHYQTEKINLTEAIN